MKHLVKMLAIAVFLFLQTTNTVAKEQLQAAFKPQNGSALYDETPISESKSDSVMSCSQRCVRDKRCKSANFLSDKKRCYLLDKTKNTHPGLFRKQVNAIHLEKVNSDLGFTQELAVPSCKSLNSAIHPSGTYWINPDGGSHANAFKVYCDTETDGGGWTLMWSYTFTTPGILWNQANAVTPRPNWQAFSEDVNVPVSTITPLHETDYNAMEFSQWKKFGKEFLVKSNINNWLLCSPATGSLVDSQNGDVTCKIAKHVTDTCPDVQPPTKLRMNWSCGVAILGPGGSGSDLYYYFEGCTTNSIPKHDPCGQGRDNSLKNVENPHGNIFVR